MIDILEVVGARPNLMKIAPIHSRLQEIGRFQVRLVHTGQHYDWEMSGVFLAELGIPRPDFELSIGAGSHAEQTARVLLGIELILRAQKPRLVIVAGDVNSTLAGALGAAKLNIPVAHVEAGLRSLDRSMPEEINRVLTDHISDLLFAPSRDAVRNLEAEGVDPQKIHFVGNVMIDTLLRLLPAAEASDVLERLGLSPRAFFVATLHRPSNVDTDVALQRVVGLLGTAARTLPVVLAAHPRTMRQLRTTGLLEDLQSQGVLVIRPLGYLDFLKLMSESAGVLTDSGGIQEETTVLGVPCLTLRANTERPITVVEGTNTVVGLDSRGVETEVRRLATLASPNPRQPELWDGRAAIRIVEVLDRWFESTG